MENIEKMTSKEIIKALNCMVGSTEPSGDADVDKIRLKNTYLLCDITKYCIERLCELQCQDQENRISDVADNALNDIWWRFLE